MMDCRRFDLRDDEGASAPNDCSPPNLPPFFDTNSKFAEPAKAASRIYAIISDFRKRACTGPTKALLDVSMEIWRGRAFGGKVSAASFAIPIHLISDQQSLLTLAVPLASILGSGILAVIATKQNKVAKDTLAHNRMHLYREFLSKRLDTLRSKAAALLEKTWVLVTEDAAFKASQHPDVTQSIFELRLTLDRNYPDQVVLDQLLSEFWVSEDRHAWHERVFTLIRDIIRSNDARISQLGFDYKSN